MSTPLLDNRQLGPDVARANLLTNGGFEIWQRGNGPFTGTGTAISSDRWQVVFVGTDTMSASRDTTNFDVSGACMAITFTLGTGAGASQILQQLPVGDNPQLPGRTLSLSVRVRTSTANAVRIALNNYYGGASHLTYSAFHPGNGSYVTLTVTATMDPTATICQASIFFAASCTAYLDNAMLVVGSQPANYVPLHPADDLARCKRYYHRIGDANDASVCYYGYADGARTWYAVMGQLPAVPAVAPTITRNGTFATTNVGAYTPIWGAVGSVWGWSIPVIATGFFSFIAGAVGQNVTFEANP